MDSENDSFAAETAQTEPDRKDFTEYASHEEGDSLVICDPENPTAWVKSDALMAVED